MRRRGGAIDDRAGAGAVLGSLLYLATDSLFQFFAVTQKSSAEAQNVALFFFGFISMFNGVAPTPSAFPVWIRWGIWVVRGASIVTGAQLTGR